MTRRIFTDTPAAHVVDRYAHAREKHPYFCDAITTFSNPYDEVIALDKARSAVRREIAQGKLLPMTLLNCAWLEAIQHYLTGNSTGAMEHLYDAISVLLRTIDVIEGRPRVPRVPRAMRNPRHTCRACGKPVADGNMRFCTACWIARKRGNFIAQRKERTQCCR